MDAHAETHTVTQLYPNVPVSRSDSSDCRIQHVIALCSLFHRLFSRFGTTFLPPPPRLLACIVLESVCVCVSLRGAPLPAVTWYWVNWVTLITFQPRISQRPAAREEQWPSYSTAAPAYLHNPWPCCYPPVGVCDSDRKRERHADTEGVRKRLLM